MKYTYRKNCLPLDVFLVHTSYTVSYTTHTLFQILIVTWHKDVQIVEHSRGGNTLFRELHVNCCISLVPSSGSEGVKSTFAPRLQQTKYISSKAVQLHKKNETTYFIKQQENENMRGQLVVLLFLFEACAIVCIYALENYS